MKESNQFILIEDDKYIILCWKIRAKSSNTALKVYTSVRDFLQESENIEKNAIFYVDVHLQNDERGEEESKQIHDLGFKNIFLCTNLTAHELELSKYPWILGLKDKNPPF